MNEDHDTTATSWVRDCGAISIPDPDFGDFKLNVYPVTHDGRAVTLPAGFDLWTETVRSLFALIPVQPASAFYVTIDSRYFPEAGTLRREGVHIDGNFVADPTFSPKTTWGPAKPTWGGLLAVADRELPNNAHVRMGWKLPYEITIPVGRYVSGSLGGFLAATSWEGCHAWPGEDMGEVLSGGALEETPLTAPTLLPAHRAIFLSSNTPHASLEIPAGTRRTLIRITFDHRYRNEAMGSS
jgi:hypothetical protein